MLQSRIFIPTTKLLISEDTTCKSLSIMLKAGMIKQVAAGIYTYLPLSNLILKNIEKIIREELEKLYCVEILMPALQPKELWEESGRWSKYGPELMRLEDRHGRPFCLGPTHEEVIVSTVRDHLKSWRQLPMSLFQIQNKFRDEKRPRYGLMRGREFIMKDAYSFHADIDDLDNYYDQMGLAYENIFSRCGLDYIKVNADSGSIGGDQSTEFMSISEIGEDTLVYCDDCSYQANLEKADAKYDTAYINENIEDVMLIKTPGISKVEDIANFLGYESNRCVKFITYIDDESQTKYLVAITGNYEINETKLCNLVNANNLRLMSDQEIETLGLIKGYIGTYKLQTNEFIKIIVDTEVTKLINHTAGGNMIDTHYINVNYGRDYSADIIGDIKEVKLGDKCINCGSELRFAKGIEVGHIFKLGTTYSEKLKCNYLDKNQKEIPMQMGCYGIGVSRILMAVVEKYATDTSILWPTELAPYEVHIIIVDIKKDVQVKLAHEIYQSLKGKNISVLLDDTSERVGSKFANSDLIGISRRIIVGKKADEEIVEYLELDTMEKIDISVADINYHIGVKL